MIELDMVHVPYFGGFLSVGCRVSFEQYMLFMLCSANKSLQPEKPAGRPESLQARPGRLGTLQRFTYFHRYATIFK